LRDFIVLGLRENVPPGKEARLYGWRGTPAATSRVRELTAEFLFPY
jgi:hypothetical protein